MNLSAFGLEPHHSATVALGDTFGRLTILAIGKKPGTYRYMAVCQCSCGSAPKIIRIDSLISGMIVGCGCIQKERSSKHGLTGNPVYNVWLHMRRRCTKETDSAYANYGARGIKICERWLNPANFVADMQQGYRKGLEIDRIDNDGNYEPSNCRWVTPSENCDNRRSRREITFNGKSQSIQRWAEETGINKATLWERIAIWNWSPERALTTPPLSAPERMAIARSHQRSGSTALPEQ